MMVSTLAHLAATQVRVPACQKALAPSRRTFSPAAPDKHKPPGSGEHSDSVPAPSLLRTQTPPLRRLLFCLPELIYAAMQLGESDDVEGKYRKPRSSRKRCNENERRNSDVESSNLVGGA